MSVELGIKSDPILYRYSWDWLFGVMRDNSVDQMQLGSYFELYSLEDSYFRDLRRNAEEQGIRIRSCFTAHRELGGFFSRDARIQRAAYRSYHRFIEIAALLGADYCGSNPGSVLRDQMDDKEAGTRRYIEAMLELRKFAATCGLQALTLEPMSCLAEPPTTHSEIESMMEALSVDCEEKTVPVYLCGDISHGYADEHSHVVEGNIHLFESSIPYLGEFHYKNTDERFGSTFGFSAEERRRGIVDLDEVLNLLLRSREELPVSELVGYLELPGPKLGRDYSDRELGQQLSDSIQAIRAAMERCLPERQAPV